MAKIEMLDRLLKKYSKWTIGLKGATSKIESNIFQRSDGAELEEKIVSIGISSLIVYVSSSILALFGISFGFLASVAFFAIGWVLSKYINKKIFGSERSHEKLTEDEQALLILLKDFLSQHNNLRDAIKSGAKPLFFTDYVNHAKNIRNVEKALARHDYSNLSFKYRSEFPFLVKKYISHTKNFHQIYAKKGVN